MRTHKLNTVLKSNVDLTVFANSRIAIKKIDTDEFLITSDLKFYSSELRIWAFNFIKRQLPQNIILISGQCSTPSGIFIIPNS